MTDGFFTVTKLSKAFQGVRAVDDLDVSVAQGEIHGVIGPNGAGKSTFFNLITGVTPADQGEIVFQGKPISGLPPHAICKRGIARTFQNIMLMSQMTVIDNVLIGQHTRTTTNLLSILFYPPRALAVEARATQVAQEVLEFVGLWDKRSELASNLAYGQQRLLEIARALATQPSLLLLDEPAAGMNPSEKAELIKTVQRIRQRGVTVIIIEHDMKVIMNSCEQITVLDFGKKIAEGTPETVRRNPLVLEAYLGRSGNVVAS